METGMNLYEEVADWTNKYKQGIRLNVSVEKNRIEMRKIKSEKLVFFFSMLSPCIYFKFRFFFLFFHECWWWCCCCWCTTIQIISLLFFRLSLIAEMTKVALKKMMLCKIDLRTSHKNAYIREREKKRSTWIQTKTQWTIEPAKKNFVC